MFGHIYFNQGAFNREASSISGWTGNAQAIATAEANLRLIKYMSGAANAVANAVAEAGTIHYMTASANAEATGTATPIRKRYMTGTADAVATGVAVSLYGIGTDYLALELNVHAGDDIIIDTERMTLMVNSQNAIYMLSDDSTFFDLEKDDYITVSGNGTATVTLLWKDRWL